MLCADSHVDQARAPAASQVITVLPVQHPTHATVPLPARCFSPSLSLCLSLALFLSVRACVHVYVAQNLLHTLQRHACFPYHQRLSHSAEQQGRHNRRCRSAITHWEPRAPEPLLAWIDAWAPLLPRGAVRQLLSSLVMPRIAAAVEAWDPTREMQPIHAWLHPWLPHLATELASVYPTIR